ncbi:hypothetical protein D3C73_1273440 [compost metagenome]
MDWALALIGVVHHSTFFLHVRLLYLAHLGDDLIRDSIFRIGFSVKNALGNMYNMDAVQFQTLQYLCREQIQAAC